MNKLRSFLITGATGFVGACLVRKLLTEKQKVTILIRKEAKLWRIKDILNEVTVVYSDLSDPEVLDSVFKSVKPDVIYHLAANGAYSYQNDPDQIIMTNIFGTWNLIKASLPYQYELFVNTGSSSEYGFKDHKTKEEDYLEPFSYYAVTKATQTLLSSYVAKSQNKPIVTFRLFSVYGPYEEQSRFIPTLMRSLLNKEEMKLVDSNIARDMIYVDDVVEAYLEIEKLKNFPGEYFNICTGKQSSIKEVVETAVKITGETTNFVWGGMENRSWDTKVWVGDNTKMKKLIGWESKITVKSGLKKTWEWYKDNFSLYNN